MQCNQESAGDSLRHRTQSCLWLTWVTQPVSVSGHTCAGQTRWSARHQVTSYSQPVAGQHGVMMGDPATHGSNGNQRRLLWLPQCRIPSIWLLHLVFLLLLVLCARFAQPESVCGSTRRCLCLNRLLYGPHADTFYDGLKEGWGPIRSNSSSSTCSKYHSITIVINQGL